jgi:hypothetical protein
LQVAVLPSWTSRGCIDRRLPYGASELALLRLSPRVWHPQARPLAAKTRSDAATISNRVAGQTAVPHPAALRRIRLMAPSLLCSKSPRSGRRLPRANPVTRQTRASEAHLVNPLGRKQHHSRAANRARAETLSSDDGAVRCERQMSANSALPTPRLTARSDATSHVSQPPRYGTSCA